MFVSKNQGHKIDGCICDVCDKEIKDQSLLINGDLRVYQYSHGLISQKVVMIDDKSHICSFRCLEELLDDEKKHFPELTM